MDIPRGHAMHPLNDSDIYDFLFNYFKAEFAPIRSFFSTANAEPRQPERWESMGNELFPISFRPANAQAQKDLEVLDNFLQRRNLDAGFVRGIIVRFAKYETHERLEKKLYENCRADLMVRKALKEKHVIDSLWPTSLRHPTDLAQQGAKVRAWYGDMFTKYFRYLHSVDDFKLRPEIDDRIRRSTQLMLIPYSDHLTFGTIEPILPIQAKGAGYERSQLKTSVGVGQALGPADRFDIRFDAPTYLSETQTKNIVRQTECLKCGTKRDVTVVMSIDPAPGPVRPDVSATSRTPAANSKERRNSKAAQRHSPGHRLPGEESSQRNAAPPSNTPSEPTSPPPSGQKRCPRCTFLNHPDLVDCEMCGADLPPASVVQTETHTYSASVPVIANDQRENEPSESSDQRPPPPNRQSLSSTLFALFPNRPALPFSHSHQPPPTAPPTTSVTTDSEPPGFEGASAPKRTSQEATEPRSDPQQRRSFTPPPPELSREPEMAMMPLSPPPTSGRRPQDMPESLLDSTVPQLLSPRPDIEEEEGGWGTMQSEQKEDEADEAEGETQPRVASPVVFDDLDAEAREAADIWGSGRDE